MEDNTLPNDSIHNSEQGTQDGLTKREYFAAIALQGICTRTFPPKHAAELAVEMADALIKELNKPNQP